MPAVKQSSAGLPSVPGRKRDGPPADIIDIRGGDAEFNLKDDVAVMLNPTEGPRKLPTLLLYDERGLQLFEDITYLEEYYLTNHEIDILEAHAANLAAEIPAGAMLVELGSGNLRKVNLILQAFERAEKSIDYYALDVSQKELERTLADVPEYKYVSCHGLLGTYDNGRDWLEKAGNVERPKCILHLGSSIGNFHRHEAVEFLAGFAAMLQPQDSVVMGIDVCNDPDKIYHAYNDSQGVTHDFILNGLAHVNSIYGEELFHIPDWRVIGEYVYDDQGGRHQAFISPTRDVQILGNLIRAHERIQIEQSVKYSRSSADRLFRLSGLREVQRWSVGEDYGVHMLIKSELPMSRKAAEYASSPVPTLQDWHGLWETWDIVTRKMLPDQELQEKPIKLRNACIFYLGHIPTFLDIQLTKTTKIGPTEPAYFWQIFERGIDPDVDNPEKCHDHSEIPEEWPSVDVILEYQQSIRKRLLSLYGKDVVIPRDVGRAIWIAFEHEAMHLETLLYMMLQSDKTLPPPQTDKPDFKKLALQDREQRVEDQWFDVPAQQLLVGTDDPEDGTDEKVFYAWDNEKPQREVSVKAFQSKGRPITNEEYAQYMLNKGIDRLPASWSPAPKTNGHTNGANGTNGTANVHGDGIPHDFLAGKSVRTVYGLVPLQYALDWPVFASYDELAGCAAWMGGRIPTAEETRSIYSYVDMQRRDVSDANSKLTRKVPAVNAHLVNNGVEETPPSNPSGSVEDSSTELFIDLPSTANIGFQNWHPTPVTSSSILRGRSDFGGAWEWTSSELVKHEGFEPMSLYPAYTADFFDGKHNVVLGGSWATHPRIAGRKSFVNWYQRNYPYVWAGARVVRDT